VKSGSKTGSRSYNFMNMVAKTATERDNNAHHAIYMHILVLTIAPHYYRYHIACQVILILYTQNIQFMQMTTYYYSIADMHLELFDIIVTRLKA